MRPSPYRSDGEVTQDMEKFDPIKMQELVKVTDSDDGSELILTFQNGRKLRISVSSGGLESEFIE